MKGKDSIFFRLLPPIWKKRIEICSILRKRCVLVMQQANVSKEKAIVALTDTKGDIAQAILNLTV